jgi:hypothetical protein
MSEKPMGIIMYTPDGFMSAQLMHPIERTLHLEIGLMVRMQHIKKKHLSILPIHGHFMWMKKREHLHSKFISPFPNWTGQTQPSIVKIEGGLLHLSTAHPIVSSGKMANSFLTWKKAKTQ